MMYVMAIFFWHYDKEKTHVAEAKDTRDRSKEEVSIHQVLGSGTGELNAVEANDRSFAALLMLAKARSQPTSTANISKLSSPVYRARRGDHTTR